MNGRITADRIKHDLINLKQLTFEVTDCCNLRCQYCGYGPLYYGYDTRRGANLAFDQVRPLIDYLIALWFTHRTDAPVPLTYFSFYGGEPLLNMPFIQQVVDYVENSNINRRIVFSMTTNGVLLNQYTEYLVAKDFHLLISLDGGRKEHSYRIDNSGVNSFDKIYNNLKALQNEHPCFFQNNVSFNAVLHNRNSVERIHHYITHEFGKKPNISALSTTGIRPEKGDEFVQMYRNKAEDIKLAKQDESLTDEQFVNDPSVNELLIYLHRYSGNVFRDYNDLLMENESNIFRPTGTCSPFSKKMFVTVNGKILQCEKIKHKFVAGYVSEASLDLDLDRVADSYNNYLDKMQNQCKTCMRNTSCIQCMYHIETIDSEIPTCPGKMNKQNFLKYSSNCLNYLWDHPYLYRKLLEEITIE